LFWEKTQIRQAQPIFCFKKRNPKSNLPKLGEPGDIAANSISSNIEV